MSQLKKGDHIIVIVSARMVDKAPALKHYLGKREWFEVTCHGPEIGIRAKWELFEMVELKILESEIQEKRNPVCPKTRTNP